MKAILFLYEGETEGEFYADFLHKKLGTRSVKFSKKCLVGVYNLNKKVVSWIKAYLDNNGNRGVSALYVFIACDREGPINQPPPFNENLIRDEFKKEVRVKQINFIVATQDLESWLFLDIDNIYSFLRAPVAKRNRDKYKNIGSLNNKHLSQLFRQFDKFYQKGKRVDGFLNYLDLDMIFGKCKELSKAEKIFDNICKMPSNKR